MAPYTSPSLQEGKRSPTLSASHTGVLPYSLDQTLLSFNSCSSLVVSLLALLYKIIANLE